MEFEPNFFEVYNSYNHTWYIRDISEIYQRYINDISTHISMINQWFDFVWFGCLTHYKHKTHKTTTIFHTNIKHISMIYQRYINQISLIYLWYISDISSMIVRVIGLTTRNPSVILSRNKKSKSDRFCR